MLVFEGQTNRTRLLVLAVLDHAQDETSAR